MDLMAQYPDKHFELAIVDPPYGIGEHGGKIRNGINGKKRGFEVKINYQKKEWDKSRPTNDYFNELFRISKNQIICGGNYFVQFLKPSMGWIYWDKKISNPNSDFSDGELIYTSFNRALRKFVYGWIGLDYVNNKNEDRKIHPTQKPVALYKWLLSRYAKPNDKILDTHFGSGSIAIACNELGFNLTASEIDQDYFNAACLRVREANKQGDLFREAV